MTQYDQVKLLALDFEFFTALVRQHLHEQDGDPKLWAVLGSDTLRSRTAASLKSILRDTREEAKKRSMQHQELRVATMNQGSHGRRAWEKANAAHQAWKVRSGDYVHTVEYRLGSIKDVHEVSREQTLTQRVKRLSANEATYRNTVEALAVRIHQHQALTARSGRDPEQHDHDLWRLLEELTVPLGDDDQPVPLQRMLRAYWFETSPATIQDGSRRLAERLMRQAPGGRSERYGGTPKVRRAAPPNSLT